MLLDGVQRSFPGGLESSEIPDPATHRAFKAIQIGLLLILPLLFSLPAAPNFIALTIMGTAMGAVTAPIIIVGVIVLTTSRKFMLPEYVNKWWETLALVVIGGIGIWATSEVVAGFMSLNGGPPGP